MSWPEIEFSKLQQTSKLNRSLLRNQWRSCTTDATWPIRLPSRCELALTSLGHRGHPRLSILASSRSTGCELVRRLPHLIGSGSDQKYSSLNYYSINMNIYKTHNVFLFSSLIGDQAKVFGRKIEVRNRAVLTRIAWSPKLGYACSHGVVSPEMARVSFSHTWLFFWNRKMVKRCKNGFAWWTSCTTFYHPSYMQTLLLET